RGQPAVRDPRGGVRAARRLPGRRLRPGRVLDGAGGRGARRGVRDDRAVRHQGDPRVRQGPGALHDPVPRAGQAEVLAVQPPDPRHPGRGDPDQRDPARGRLSHPRAAGHASLSHPTATLGTASSVPGGAVVVVSTIVVVMTGVVCALAGAAAARAVGLSREAALREELAALRAASTAEEGLLDAFRSVSGQALQEQSEHLYRVAEHRYQLLERTAEQHWRAQGESLLGRLGEHAAHLRELEAQRTRDAAALRSAVEELRRANAELRDEARGLAAALTHNRVRGTWGEVQLRRVLEAAGMEAHADFVEQQGVTGPDRHARPDVVVRLPNERCVVIDAKAPLDGYLRAAECDDPDERATHLASHARAVAAHVTALSRRRYEELVEGAVDFVVMFVPGDAFLSAAFEV